MQKWDYLKVDVIHMKLQETLDEHGNDGWELCGQAFLGKTWSLIFKRPQVD